MSDTASSDISAPPSSLPGEPGALESAPGSADRGHGHSGSKAALAVGAIGIVFGDIGTSPLYAFRETFSPQNSFQIAIDRMHVLGVVSLIFWSM
ncbi:MAG: KUP/HAK/KT family potassium transporter, partial [Erythrobacter sp.]|nr:KUP/HAK/KT family potassium transporter [Erythrobacter sp.]